MRSTYTRLRWALLVLGCALMAAAGLSWRAGGEGVEPVPAPEVRGIVLVCVDTLRADGMSLPGEPEGPMTRLQAFARDAMVFADATASSAWTEPSVTSLLTGLRPLHHGLLPFFGSGRLVPSVVTIAERLKAGGWSTGAITAGGWVSPEVGLAQGFDTFATTFDEVAPKTSLRTWNALRRKDRPYFLLLHTCNAHDPYGRRPMASGREVHLPMPTPLTPVELVAGLDRHGGRLPEDLLSRFGRQFLADPRGRQACRQVVGGHRYEALGIDLIPWYEGGYAVGGDGPAVAASLRDAYRQGLESVDEQVGQAFDELSRLGLLEHADVMVVGDHGEGFGEHGVLWHGLHLHDEVLRVPMVVRVQGRASGPRVVHGACDLTDAAATILDLAGLLPSSGLDGRSLLALADRADPGRTAVAELERNLDQRRPSEGRVRWFSARSLDWKWILRYDPEDATMLGESLYHLAADPGETSPLPSAETLPPGVGDEFRRVVEEERGRLRRLANPNLVTAGYLPR